MTFFFVTSGMLCRFKSIFCDIMLTDVTTFHGTSIIIFTLFILSSQDKREGKEGNILDFVKMEEDDDEPMSLADRLKLKGSPVDVIKNGGAAVKEKKPKVQRGTVNHFII